MTSAKPKLMAGQNDSADDLIAELARLMAEDAQDKPKSESAPVRIPGGEAAAAPTARKEPQAEPQIRPVRIPGDAATNAPSPFSFDFDRSRRQETEPKAEGESAHIEPTVFAFEQPKAAPAEAPVEPQAYVPAAERSIEPQVAVPAEPVAVTPQEVAPAAEAPVMPDLDQDSLASLIAAELAVAEKVEEAEKTFEPEQARTEEIDVPKEVAGQDLPRNVDSFGIPPVFGLASKPAAQPEVHPEPPAPVVPEVNIASRDTEDAFVPPPAHRAAPLPDPLEEIERLIGPAARVQHNPPAPSPALRSLATPVIPKREPEAAKVSPPSHGANVSSIEEAILAAAATSGAKVEWVESSIAATLPAMDDDIKERAPRGRIMGMGRSIAGPLVATLLLAVAAVGLYTVLGLGSNGTTGPAPLLVADTAPTKEVPAEAPDASEANQSVVFNEISGANTAADEQIVSRDQTDVDAVTAVAANDVNTEGLVNRKVRTVTVRPDGTIVSGSDSLAGSAMLPVDRPTVPNVPGADFSTPELIANADANAAATTSTPAAQTASVPATPTLPPVTPGSTVQAVDMAGNPIRGKTAPVPLSRPANLAPQAAVTTPSAPAAQNTTTTAAATTTLPEPAPTAPQQSAQPVQAAAVTAPEGNPAPAYVQLSSQRSEEAARQTAQQIVNRYGPLFGGASLEVQRVDLGERGIFYRVRVPANSLESAMNICTNVKAAGGDCFTL